MPSQLASIKCATSGAFGVIALQVAEDATFPGARFLKIDVLLIFFCLSFLYHNSFNSAIFAFNVMADLAVGTTSLTFLLHLHDNLRVFLLNGPEQILLIILLFEEELTIIILEVQFQMAWPTVELLEDLAIFDFLFHGLRASPDDGH